jgi:predicted nucleotidyltransferase
LVKEAKRRAEIFNNLEKYLRKIVDVVIGLDGEAEVYIFGSVAEGRHLLSSDIDILVVTTAKPGEVLAALWDAGIKDPFEIHVVLREMMHHYVKRAKLVKINP